MEENKEQGDKENQFPGSLDRDNIEEAELEDVLESVPPKHRKVIEKMMISSSIHMRSISSPETEVMKKLTPSHISQYLEGAELEMKNSYAEKFHRKVFTFLTMFVAMVFFIFLVILLRDNPDVMEKVIYTVGGGVVGAFGGYGFGKAKGYGTPLSGHHGQDRGVWIRPQAAPPCFTHEGIYDSLYGR